MKILHLLSWYAERPGGTDGALFRNMVREMGKLGVSTDLLYASMDARGWREKIRFAGRLWLSGTEEPAIYRYYRFFPPKRLPFVLECWEKRYLKVFLSYVGQTAPPDLIHAHSFWAGLAARRISEKFHIPFLITEHSRLPSAAWLRERAADMYRAAAGITCVSEQLQKDVELMSGKTAAVIPNFYDPAVFSPAPRQKRGQVVFLSIGSPAWVKGYDLLLPAFSALLRTGRDRAVLRLGDKIRGERKLRRLIRALNIGDKVSFLGAMTPLEVARQMQQADIYVSASRFETFGMTIIEALACGLPVVATNTYGPASFLNPGQGLLTPVAQSGHLAKAMAVMYDSYQQYDPARLSESVRQLFAAGAVVPRYVQLYTDILQGHDR